jgi:outer membrane phospholipase A
MRPLRGFPATLPARGLMLMIVLVFALPAAAAEPSPVIIPPDATRNRSDQLADNFFGHEPVYFVYGPNPDHAKFQISFKYRLINPKGTLTQRWHQAANFYLGYTQTSFWDWTSDSAPFYDSSYKPEFFYFEPGIQQYWVPAIGDIDLQTGLQHESNGRDGADSRSLNFAYIKTKAYVGNRNEAHVTVAPRVWAYIGDLEDNPDIDRYRGYFDVELALVVPKGLKIASTLRVGTGADKGSIEIDATYPLSQLFFGNLDIYAQVQYFNGYAETLLSYDESHSFLRFGVAVYR